MIPSSWLVWGLVISGHLLFAFLKGHAIHENTEKIMNRCLLHHLRCLRSISGPVPVDQEVSSFVACYCSAEPFCAVSEIAASIVFTLLRTEENPII